MQFGHGDDGYLYREEIIANFSSNVYPEGLTDGLKKHLASKLDLIKNYPEADARTLKKRLSSKHGLPESFCVITNGATEAFYLIAHAFRGTSATIITPTFSEYEDACTANDINLTFISFDVLNTETVFETSLVFICNPNNPTGSVLSVSTITKLVSGSPKATFIIDEAYIDFTSSTESAVPLLDASTNLIIVKSLTKAYAIPGLRLGFILSNGETIERINNVKMPWSVNALALAAGQYIVDRAEHIHLPVNDLLRETSELVQKLNSIPGIKANETKTNFFLAKTQMGTASELKDFLIRPYGVLIRDASNFRGLKANCFRIASQGEEKNELLVKGLTEWSQKFYS